MSDAALRNLASGIHYRDKRLRGLMEGSIQPGGVISLSPGWDNFFGSLDQQADDAAAQGLNFRTDLSGIGGRPLMGGGGRLTPTDVAGIIGNQQLAEYNTQSKLGDAAVR